VARRELEGPTVCLHACMQACMQAALLPFEGQRALWCMHPPVRACIGQWHRLDVVIRRPYTRTTMMLRSGLVGYEMQQGSRHGKKTTRFGKVVGLLDGAGGAFSEAFSGFPYSRARLLVPPSRLFHRTLARRVEVDHRHRKISSSIRERRKGALASPCLGIVVGCHNSPCGVLSCRSRMTSGCVKWL